MNTPITDAASFHRDNGAKRQFQIVVDLPTARRLELDRAALMEALEKVEELTEQELPAHVWSSIITALAAARANFPTP